MATPAHGSVAGYLSARTGLAFPHNRTFVATAAIERLMKESNVLDQLSFIAQLESDEGAFDDLIAEVTVGETYFFRDFEQFEYIGQHIIPRLLHVRVADEVLYLWSAGCATGEEAYSLAILFQEAGLAERSHILATDISRASLARAARAVYPRWSLRGAPLGRLAPYLEREGDRFRLSERIRNKVEFKALNLMGSGYPDASSVDLILCRNVLIHLTPEACAHIARRLFECLRSDGWLITGPSDPPLWEHAPFHTVVTTQGIFYQRAVTGSVSFARDSIPQHAPSIQKLHSPRSRSGGAKVSGREIAATDGNYGSPPPPARSTGAQSHNKPIPDAGEAFAQGAYELVAQMTSPRDPDPERCLLHLKALGNLVEISTAERTTAVSAELHPLHPGIQYVHSVLLLGMERREEAMAALRRVLYLDRTLAVAHLTLGSICRQLGDKPQARRAFGSACALLAVQSPDAIVPLSDGETARRLADYARNQLTSLETLYE